MEGEKTKECFPFSGTVVCYECDLVDGKKVCELVKPEKY